MIVGQYSRLAPLPFQYFRMKIELDQSPPTHFDFMIFWANLPLLFKCLLPFTYILAIIGMFTDLPIDLFANIGVKSLLHVQLWRVLTSPYISLGMLHYTICMINLYYILPRLERTYSTAFVVIDFVVQNLCIQVVFMLVIGVVHDFTEIVEDCYSAGLWNILIIYLVRVCYAEPKKEIQMCCMPFKMRTVYYPFVMLIIYNIFTLPLVEVDIYLSFIWAMIQTKCANGNFFKYSPRLLLVVERWIIRMIGERVDITKVSESKYEEYYNGVAVEEGNGSRTETELTTIKEMRDGNQGQEKESEHVHNHQCDHTI